MPFLKKIEVEGGTIGLWNITEKPEDFSWLKDKVSDDPTYLKLASDKRKTEFLAVRALVAELTGGYKTIRYENNGSPWLEGSGDHLSISHSINLAAIILHKKRAGIDAERLVRKVREISYKFLSESELAFTEATIDPEKWMTVMWCAKEAVYKMAGVEGVDFIKQIVLKPFETGISGIINAEFIRSAFISEINLNYFFLNDNAIVWGVY